MKRNTLDLDFNDQDRIDLIRQKLRARPCCAWPLFKISPGLNGFHVVLECKKNCDLCRLVFDDQERFSRDLRRPVRTRDVLWSKKSFLKAGHTLIMEGLGYGQPEG